MYLTYEKDLLQDLVVFDLGLVDFQEAYDFQKNIFAQIKDEKLNFAAILCQHYPVITLGRMGKTEDILMEDYQLKKRNINIYNIERGGEVTYHGPGQLLIYPIFNLNYFHRDIRVFLRWLEELAIRILDKFDIIAQRYAGLTGVWVGEEKIASIGIAVKNWITFHGLSINVKEEDLKNFSLIRPCGMNITMTSIERRLKRRIQMEEVKAQALYLIRRTLEW